MLIGKTIPVPPYRPEFKPFVLHITVESEEEARRLYSIFGLQTILPPKLTEVIKDKIKSSIPPPTSLYSRSW